ncbi:MAG: Glutamyl-Q tRNA(Asp) synthetase [Solirubrobacterales bacterium]|nr:Glutamyl-Q tRNA(Asp) synthetase [Solirubrobacterales bacterium]
MAPNGRYAPSPSGPLHLGNLRTALLAWLFARSAGARFLVRVEDLDRGRSRPEHEAGQLADLAAIGLDWDGEVVRQSERSALYDAAIARLDTYPCFCTRAEIREAASAPHGAVGLYPGTCRELTTAQRAQREAEGRRPALRLRAPAGLRAGFVDRVLGPFDGPVDDLVVRRNDGIAAYNLAVVVDDHDQGIGEVVRGADLIDATPGQLHLCDVLGFERPAHAHVPLVLAPDGARLAKRHGAVTLADRAAAGESAAAVRAGLLASVGLPRDLAAACATFDPSALPSESTVLTPEAIR